MTKRLPFTEASLKRAIRAAQACGLRVVGVKPDGTLQLQDKTECSTVSDMRPPYEAEAWGFEA